MESRLRRDMSEQMKYVPRLLWHRGIYSLGQCFELNVSDQDRQDC